MRNGQAFVGFREAPINFPPTFKYDVLRTIKHKHKGSKRRHAAAQALARLPHGRHTPELGDELEQDRRHDGALSESSEDEGGDIASVVSSGTTFSQRDHASDEDNDSDAESDYLRRRMSYQQRSGGLVKRFSVTAAQRAKSKLAELINAQTSPRIIRTRRPNATAPQPEANGKNVRSVPTTPLLGQRVAPPTTDEADDDVLSNAPSFASRGRSTRSFTGDGTVQDDDDKGVYDSSSKQRVPSWCDRILFKSTVKPDPDPEDDAPTAPRTAVSLLAQAWRTFRRTSSASLRSTTTVATTVSGTSTTSATSSFTSSSAMSPTDSEPESPATARPSQHSSNCNNNSCNLHLTSLVVDEHAPALSTQTPCRQCRSLRLVLPLRPLGVLRRVPPPARHHHRLYLLPRALNRTHARMRGPQLTEVTVASTSAGGCSPSFRAMVRRREMWMILALRW
jgi:hypothetical protein